VTGGSVSVAGGMAAVERDGDRYYLLIPLRNDGRWRCGVVRHWVLEGVDPRER
jgi:hypothetical protein